MRRRPKSKEYQFSPARPLRKGVVPAVFVLVLLGLVALCSVLLFAPSLWAQYWREISDRIAVAALATELVGVLALLLAALEYYRSQRMPMLRLWLADIGDDHVDAPVLLHDPRRPAARWLGVHMANNGARAAKLRVYLENHGDVPAQWVRVVLVITPSGASLIRRERRATAGGEWSPPGFGRTSDRFTFYGGSDFVVYDRPGHVGFLLPWLEPLGDFELRLAEIDGDGKTALAFIHCSIQAIGCRRVTQEYSFESASAETLGEMTVAVRATRGPK
jgi:hypothetical protein